MGGHSVRRTSLTPVWPFSQSETLHLEAADWALSPGNFLGTFLLAHKNCLKFLFVLLCHGNSINFLHGDVDFLLVVSLLKIIGMPSLPDFSDAPIDSLAKLRSKVVPDSTFFQRASGEWAEMLLNDLSLAKPLRKTPGCPHHEGIQRCQQPSIPSPPFACRQS